MATSTYRRTTLDIKARKRVIVTGGLGNLGTKVVAGLHESPDLEVVVLDRAQGDLRKREGGWEELLRGADTVVHLAAQSPFPKCTWKDSLASFDITANVFLAAVKAKVRRVVFASSNHVMGGLKEEGTNSLEARPIGHLTDPCPGTKQFIPEPSDSTRYAVAKTYGERLAAALASDRGGETSFYCLRIGWCQPGANSPRTLSFSNPVLLGPLNYARAKGGGGDANDQVGRRVGNETLWNAEKLSEWFQLMWLSNRDFLQICEKAIRSPPAPGGFGVVNAVSGNTNMRWSLESARDWLGYAPQDDVTLHDRPGHENAGRRRIQGDTRKQPISKL